MSISSTPIYIIAHFPGLVQARQLKVAGKIKVRETEGAIWNGQSSETVNIGYTRQIKQKTQHNMSWTPPYTRHKTKTSKVKTTTQCVLDTTMRKQTQITKIRPEPSYKQLVLWVI